MFTVKLVDPRKVRSLADLDSSQLASLNNLEISPRANPLGLARLGEELAVFPNEALVLRRTSSGHLISAVGRDGLEPIAEVLNASQEALQPLIEAHNRKVVLKSPLMIDFSCTPRPSLLSAPFGEQPDYSGFVNLLILFSVLNYAPIVLKHLLGDLRLVPQMAEDLLGQMLRVEALLFPALVACYFAAVHSVQVWSFHQRPPELGVFAGITALSGAYLYLGLKMNMELRLPILLGGMLNLGIVSGLLKMISYAHVLYTVRWLLRALEGCADESARQKLLEEYVSALNVRIILGNEHHFPRFLSLSAYCYYLAAPTFCYQLRYPRSPIVRKLWLVQKVLELLGLAAVCSFIVYHWLFPALREAPGVIARRRPLEFSLYILRLALPYTLAWIAGFIAVFHVWLNILAELMRFGDREFYREWWNCRNLAEYWRDWNLPVHSFFLRHVNRPLQNLGLPKVAINFFVFFVSAAAHEYVISLSVGKVSGWVLSAFTLQYIFIVLELCVQRFFAVGRRVGNFVFWFSLCVVAQPALLLLYYLTGRG